MKKLYMIITLFVFSFFFVSYEVKASELTIDISFDKITDTFLNIKNLSDEFISNNNYDTYIIVYTDDYYIYFFNNSDNKKFKCNNYYDHLSCNLYTQGYTYKYNINNSLVSIGNISSFSSNIYLDLFSNLLYSNIPVLYKGSSNDILNLNYNGNTLTVLYEETIPLVYDLYLLNNPLDNPHQEEINKLESFYTLCIDKLSYLVTSIVSNYIYLSIFGIFILIIIFELIKRRFL